MATWKDVEDCLFQNFDSDLGMTALSGPEAFAAEVPNDFGIEVILVMNVSDVLVQFDGFLSAKAFANLDRVFPLLDVFGIKKTDTGVALHHIALLETLDAEELLGPLNLMSKEMHKINSAI
jgi:hypothetical protein